MDSGPRTLTVHFSLACLMVSWVHELRIKIKTFGTQTKKLARKIISFNVIYCVCVYVYKSCTISLFGYGYTIFLNFGQTRS